MSLRGSFTCWLTGEHAAADSDGRCLRCGAIVGPPEGGYDFAPTPNNPHRGRPVATYDDWKTTSMLTQPTKTCDDCEEELEIRVVEGAYTPLGLVIACDCEERPVQGVTLEGRDYPAGWS